MCAGFSFLAKLTMCLNEISKLQSRRVSDALKILFNSCRYYLSDDREQQMTPALHLSFLLLFLNFQLLLLLQSFL